MTKRKEKKVQQKAGLLPKVLSLSELLCLDKSKKPISKFRPMSQSYHTSQEDSHTDSSQEKHPKVSRNPLIPASIAHSTTDVAESSITSLVTERNQLRQLCARHDIDRKRLESVEASTNALVQMHQCVVGKVESILEQQHAMPTTSSLEHVMRATIEQHFQDETGWADEFLTVRSGAPDEWDNY